MKRVSKSRGHLWSRSKVKGKEGGKEGHSHIRNKKGRSVSVCTLKHTYTTMSITSFAKVCARVEMRISTVFLLVCIRFFLHHQDILPSWVSLSWLQPPAAEKWKSLSVPASLHPESTLAAGSRAPYASESRMQISPCSFVDSPQLWSVFINSGCRKH